MGTVNARYAPRTASVNIRKITEREWAENQYADSSFFEALLGSLLIVVLTLRLV
jgi:hypothetical protein